MPTVTINRGEFKEIFYKAMWFDLMEEGELIPHEKLNPLLTPEKADEYRERMEAYRRDEFVQGNNVTKYLEESSV